MRLFDIFDISECCLLIGLGLLIAGTLLMFIGFILVMFDL